MLVIFVSNMFKGSRERKAMMFGSGPYMVTAELGDRTLELESEFVVDIDDLRVFRYSDLCRCSKDGFSRCLTLWGLDGIEKEFGLISGYSYKRDRDKWSMDWTDQRVLINTDLRLLVVIRYSVEGVYSIASVCYRLHS